MRLRNCKEHRLYPTIIRKVKHGKIIYNGERHILNLDQNLDYVAVLEVSG